MVSYNVKHKRRPSPKLSNQLASVRPILLRFTFFFFLFAWFRRDKNSKATLCIHFSLLIIDTEQVWKHFFSKCVYMLTAITLRRTQQVYGTPQASGPVPLQKWYWLTPQSLYSSPPQHENWKTRQYKDKSSYNQSKLIINQMQNTKLKYFLIDSVKQLSNNFRYVINTFAETPD